jgi:hypothetical protein
VAIDFRLGRVLLAFVLSMMDFELRHGHGNFLLNVIARMT